MVKARRNTAPARYADAGVDIGAGSRLVAMIGPAVESTRRQGSLGALGGFGGLFDLKATGYYDPILVAATDGVGTKLRIAVEAGQLGTIGIDLVAMCVNDLIVQGAEPLFFLDYYAADHLDPGAAAEVVEGIAAGCRSAGAALLGGETAEMPGLYSGKDFDLAGFAVGAVERERILPSRDIAAGDALLGLAASGIHANGFSLVRKLVTDAMLDYRQRAPFDDEKSLADALLMPTRIYVKPVLQALNNNDGVKALAHITGGGLTENLTRALNADLAAEIDLGSLDLPRVLGWVRELGAMADGEFLRTFNGGIGMVAVVAAEQADAAAALLESDGDRVRRIGQIVDRTGGAAVRYLGRLGRP